MTIQSGLAKYLSQHSDLSKPDSHTSPLPSLYADLSRQRKSNPAGFAASIEWWKAILQDVTFRGVQFDRDPPSLPSSSCYTPSSVAEAVDRTVFRLDESTKSRWTVDAVGRPLGLGTVIAELEKNGVVVAYNTFLNSKETITGPTARSGRGLRGYIPTPAGVASALLVTPAKWAASQLYSLAIGGGAGDEEGEYSEDEQLFRMKKGDWVFYSLVERLATAFLTQHYATEATISPLSRLMTQSEFREKLNGVCEAEFGFHPSERDAGLVLKHLARDRGGAVLHQSSIIKLAPTEGEMAEAITEEDRSVLAVRSTLRRIELQITSLESQISHRTTQAKGALRNGQKSQASSYLRLRKALDEVLEKRMGTRETLTNVVLKIEQAKSDVEVIRAYKASDEVLRNVLGSEEIRLENVERVVEGLQDSLASQREVDQVLHGGGVGVVDEEELERELDGLVAEKRLEQEGERSRREREKEDQRQDEVKRLTESEKERTNRLAETDWQESKKGRKKEAEDELSSRFEKLRVAQVPTLQAGKQVHTSTLEQKPQEQSQNEPEPAS